MSKAEELISFIESTETAETERETAISKLNLLGIGSSEVEERAYKYWQNYFTQNIEEVLTKRIVLISHLLPDELLNQCFSDVFKEYQQRKKDLGIDNIQKFWGW